MHVSTDAEPMRQHCDTPFEQMANVVVCRARLCNVVPSRDRFQKLRATLCKVLRVPALRISDRLLLLLLQANCSQLLEAMYACERELHPHLD